MRWRATKTSGSKYSVKTASVVTRTDGSLSRIFTWWCRPPSFSSELTVSVSTCQPGLPRQRDISSGSVQARNTWGRG